jgi:hypothetical protein
MLTDQEKAILNLQALIDYFRAHPNAPVPGSLSEDGSFYCGLDYDAEKCKQQILSIGGFKKVFGIIDAEFHVPVGEYTIKYYTRRDNICERKVVGMKQVPEKVIPARVIPAHQEEIVEWECPDSVLAKLVGEK